MDGILNYVLQWYVVFKEKNPKFFLLSDFVKSRSDPFLSFKKIIPICWKDKALLAPLVFYLELQWDDLEDLIKYMTPAV